MLLEYLPKTTLVWTEDIKYTLNSIKNYFKKIEDKDINRNPLFISKEQLIKVIEKFTVIESNSHSYFTPQHEVKLDTDLLTRFNKQFDLLKQEMQKHTKQGIQNVILCSSEEQEKDLMQYLIKMKKLNTNVSILLFIRDILITLIILQYILIMKFLKDISNYKTRTKFSKEKAITIQQLTNLLIGDFVIHIDHGIGKYEGLHKIKTNGKDQEVLKITYQHGDILYTSIHSLHKIAKYSGKEGVTPKINQLGSQLWKKKKEKTKSKVKQVAFNLINLYAKRK